MRFKVNSICFDMWGTLVRGGGRAQIEELKRILGGQNIDENTFLKEIEQSLLTQPWTLEESISNLSRQLGLKVNEGVVKKGYESWWGYIQRSRPFPETEEVLVKLKRKNKRMIIVSNTDLLSIQFKLKKLGWNKYFERLFISAEMGILKPDIRMFEAAERYLGTSKKEILMVDDSLYHGVLPARQFGWQALWVARGKQGSGLGKIEDLKGVLEFLMV